MHMYMYGYTPLRKTGAVHLNKTGIHYPGDDTTHDNHAVISGCTGCCCTPGSLPIERSSLRARSTRPRQAPAAPPATALATAWPPHTRERRRLSLRW
eukprot:scaffold80969_cov80-Phaeocystis_antarctica.AAC.2